MDFNFAHLSDEDLLRAIDGELPEAEAADAEAHLENCWSCRARRQEIESAITVFMKVHERNLSPNLPQPAAPRALLRARIAQMPSSARSNRLPPLWIQIAAVIVVAAFVTVLVGRWASLRRLTAASRALSK